MTLLGCVTFSGCSISYQNHHRSKNLLLFHNAHPAKNTLTELAPDLDPAWAEEVLVMLVEEFAVEIEKIAPVKVFMDHRDWAKSSRFNRLTKTIVLKVGQARLPRLYLHELTHLLLDHIDGAPPYWVDQGLSIYMESR